MPVKVPQPLSPGEEEFMLHCRAYKLEPVREFKFCERGWRFDFAFPEKKIGIEVEGGTWTNGRHNRASGYEKDLQKYNAAARLGWLILRYSTRMVTDGTAIDEVLEVLSAYTHLKGERR